MSYIIVFMVLLLVVLVIKKQRTKAKPLPSKAAPHRPHKTTERLSFLSQKFNKTPVVAQATRGRKAISNAAVHTDFSKEESVFELKHDFAQEAVLNSALKKDPTQYNLYLELLSLHFSHQNHLAAQLLLLQIEKVSHPDLYQQALELQRIEQLQHANQTSALPSQIEIKQQSNSDLVPTDQINPREDDLEIILTQTLPVNAPDFAEPAPNLINTLYIQGLDPDPNTITATQNAPVETELALIEYFIDQAHAIKPSAKVKLATQVSSATEVPPAAVAPTEPANLPNLNLREQHDLVPNPPKYPSQSSASRLALAEIQAADAALALEVQGQLEPNRVTQHAITGATAAAIDVSFQDPHATLDFDFPTIDGITEIPQNQIITPENINLFKIEFDPAEIKTQIAALKNEVKK